MDMQRNIQTRKILPALILSLEDFLSFLPRPWSRLASAPGCSSLVFIWNSSKVWRSLIPWSSSSRSSNMNSRGAGESRSSTRRAIRGVRVRILLSQILRSVGYD